MFVTVSVNLSNTKYGEYSYSVSKHEYDQLKVGSQVVVNVNNQLKLGTVIKLGLEARFKFKLKPILGIFKANPLNEYQKQLAKPIYESSVSSYLQVQSLFVPKISDSKINIEYYKNGELIGNFKQNKELRNEQCDTKCIVEYKDEFKTYSYVQINKEVTSTLTAKQQIAYDYVKEKELISVSKLMAESGVSRGVIDTMIKNKVLIRTMQSKQFETLFELDWHKQNELTPAQSFAYESITDGQNLLYGVSSSGKTEIYIETIKANLALGKQTLVIVPSVMLAVQVVGRLQKQFSSDVIIYHQSLTESEKHSYSQQISNNIKKIVVSTFPGVFLPFKDLGDVIFDEAHSSNYKVSKQINVNKQVVIDALIKQGINVLLGTATPLINDYAMTQYSDVNLITLNERYGVSEFPEVRFIKPPENLISDDLTNLIKINKTRQKPTIIFFNKAGYSRQILCNDCYHLHICPNCHKPLSYSKRNNKLECKYDGYTKPFKQKCEKCQSTNIKYIGIGIEQFQSKLKEQFPELKIASTDGSMKADELHELMRSFGSGEIDVLIGTQTIAFGIDFLNVDNIYVVNIDNLLTLNEVSSHEKVYNLLEQVVGRVGRNSKFSNAIIETDFADHYVMRAIKEHSFYDYYNAEIKLRKLSNNPPFYRICKIELLAENQQKLENIANQFKYKLEAEGYNASELQKPYIEYRYNKHRRYFIVKYKHHDIRKVIKENLKLLVENNIDYNIDLNNNEIGV